MSRSPDCSPAPSAYRGRAALCCGLVLGLICQTAVAQRGLVLSSMQLELGGGKSMRGDITATNEGSQALTVEVLPALIRNPGRTDESRLDSPDPDEVGLLAAPRQFRLEPGATRLIRLAALKPADQADRIHRVRILPRAAEAAAPEQGAALNIRVGYDVLVIVRPREQQRDLQTLRADGKLQIRNQGNTNALLMEGEQCPPAEGECVRVQTRRVYSGAAVEIDLPLGDAPVSYLVSWGDDVERREF